MALSACIRRRVATRAPRALDGRAAPVLACIPGSLLVSTPSFSEDVVRSRIQKALSDLSEPERAVFVLYEMKGLPGKRDRRNPGVPGGDRLAAPPLRASSVPQGARRRRQRRARGMNRRHSAIAGSASTARSRAGLVRRKR